MKLNSIVPVEKKKRYPIKSYKAYYVWNDMKQRCYNPNDPYFKFYGGRGITICEEWRNSFLSFYEWTKNKRRKGLTIDRRDNNGNYCPENCRFVTTKVNNRNKMVTKLNTKKVRIIKHLLKEGELSKVAIGRMFGVTDTAVYRINKGLLWN